MARRRQHVNPEGRPVHPDCQRVGDAGLPCNCPDKWFYWDGTTTELDRRIANQDRLDNRTRAGWDVDVDDLDDELIELDSESSVAGFWRESEFLRAVAGKDFASAKKGNK